MKILVLRTRIIFINTCHLWKTPLKVGFWAEPDFCDNKESVVVEFVNQDRFLLIVDGQAVTLNQTNIEVIISFLLDATEEYMNYDHIDFEFPKQKVDVCFMRI